MKVYFVKSIVIAFCCNGQGAQRAEQKAPQPKYFEFHGGKVMNCFAANIHIIVRLTKRSTQGRQKELPFMFGRGVF